METLLEADTMEIVNVPFAALERAEMKYWSGYYDRANSDLKSRLGLDTDTRCGALCVSAARHDVLAFNRCIGLGIDEPISESHIRCVMRYFDGRDIPRYFVQVAPQALSLETKVMLEMYGFREYNFWSKFWRTLRDVPAGSAALSESLLESGITITVIGADQAGVFAEIANRAFEYDIDGFMAGHIGESDWLHYLAWKDGRPVAASSMMIRGEQAVFTLCATLPEARNYGIQSALIKRRMHDAVQRGCTWACTETAMDRPEKPAPSARNMIRHGFQLAYHRPNYIYIRR